MDGQVNVNQMSRLNQDLGLVKNFNMERPTEYNVCVESRVAQHSVLQ